jgi:hypothetical protein
MRVAWAVLGAFSFAVAGCLVIGPTSSSTTSTGTGSTGSTTSSSATGGSGCDSQATCNDCTACAMQSTCANQIAACENNSACVGLEGCVALCGTTPGCGQQCEMNNADGIVDYNTKMTCLYCTACPNRCAGLAMCTKG